MEQGNIAGRRQMQTRNLPPELAAKLAPFAQDALGHPLRREILRALNESDEPRSPGELTTALPRSAASVVSYHAQILEGCGCISAAGTRQTRGGVARLYSSNVAGDEQLVSVLEAMRQLDRRSDG